MSKYSSFKDFQLITERWRKFLNEGDVVDMAAFRAKRDVQSPNTSAPYDDDMFAEPTSEPLSSEADEKIRVLGQKIKKIIEPIEGDAFINYLAMLSDIADDAVEDADISGYGQGDDEEGNIWDAVVDELDAGRGSSSEVNAVYNELRPLVDALGAAAGQRQRVAWTLEL